MRLESALSFGDAVNINLSLKVKGRYGTFKGEFKPNVILERLYEIFGANRYIIVVHDYKKKPRPNAKSGSQQKSSFGDFLYRIFSRVYPIHGIPKEIPYRNFGTEDDIADALAHYFLTAFIDLDREAQDCLKVLCFSDLSSNLGSLDMTVNAFDILFRGRSHPECANLDDVECAEKASQMFSAALQQDPDNDHARFGLGLINLRLARNAIGKGSAYTVGKFLINGVDHLLAVRKNNRFLAALLESPEWQALLRQLEGYTDLGLEKAFLDTADNYRLARQRYIEARYKDVPALIAKVKPRPSWVDGHFKALELSARMMTTTDQPELSALVNEFSAIRDEVDIWVWAPIYGFQLCRLATNEAASETDVREALDLAISTAPERTEILNAIAHKGRCLAMLGHTEEAHALADEVGSRLEREDVSGKNRSVFLTLGYLYAETQQYRKAQEYFLKAIAFDRAYLDHLRKSSFLERFRNTPEYRELLLKALPESPHDK